MEQKKTASEMLAQIENDFFKGVDLAKASLLKDNEAQGEMVEWSITTVLKTVARRRAGGSNPSLSAKILRNPLKISGFLISPS